MWIRNTNRFSYRVSVERLPNTNTPSSLSVHATRQAIEEGCSFWRGVVMMLLELRGYAGGACLGCSV